MAFVVKKADCEENKARVALLETSRLLLKDWERPTEYRFIDKLPRTSIGKVDFKKLENIVNNT